MNYKDLKNQTAQMPTLQEIITEKRQWNTTHRPFDRTVRLDQYHFQPRELGVAESVSSLIPFVNIIVPDPKNLPVVPPTTAPVPLTANLTTHAVDQLLARLDIRKKDFTRLPPGIMQYVADWYILHENDGKEIFIRMQDENTCRAVLSTSFKTFDDLELLEMIAPVCPPDSKVHLAWDDELTMHLSLTFPDTKTAVRVGDMVESGIHISNSEVGMRSVTIAPFVWRLRCRNGLVGLTGNGDNGDGVSRFHHMGDGKRMRDAVQLAIASVMTDYPKLTAQFREALDKAIADPAQKLADVVKEHELTKDDYKEFLDKFFHEETVPDYNLFGVVNAITATARDRNGENAFALQRVASQTLITGLQN